MSRDSFPDGFAVAQTRPDHFGAVPSPSHFAGNYDTPNHSEHHVLTIGNTVYDVRDSTDGRALEDFKQSLKGRNTPVSDNAAAMGGQRNIDGLGQPTNNKGTVENASRGLSQLTVFYDDNPAKLSPVLLGTLYMWALSVVIMIISFLGVMDELDINYGAYHLAMSIVLLVSIIILLVVLVRNSQRSQSYSTRHHQRVTTPILGGTILFIIYWIALSLLTWRHGDHIDHHDKEEFGRLVFTASLGVVSFIFISYFLPGAYVSAKHPERREPYAILNGEAPLSEENLQSFALFNGHKAPVNVK